MDFVGIRSIEDLLKYSSEEDYRGHHKAPDKESNSPLYDVTLNETYPEDIYSSNGARYYGDGLPTDNLSVSIIQQARGKPNYRVKIYRAVPDINQEVNKKIKEIQKIISYYNKFNFFPAGNEFVDEVYHKYSNDLYTKYNWDEMKELMVEDMINQIEELSNSKQEDLIINVGDWVTISREYAKMHGESNLNGFYKILTKTVSAKDLFTDGNSTNEWGYFPQ